MEGLAKEGDKNTPSAFYTKVDSLALASLTDESNWMQEYS